VFLMVFHQIHVFLLFLSMLVNGWVETKRDGIGTPIIMPYYVIYIRIVYYTIITYSLVTIITYSLNYIITYSLVTIITYSLNYIITYSLINIIT